MKQLSGQDAMFIFGESPNTPMHISLVQIYDPSSTPGGQVRFRDILRTFEQRLHRSPVFSRRLARVPLDMDHPFWLHDREVDVEYHVRHLALPKPGDWRQFCIQVARLHARGLDMSRPLWEATIIEGLDNVEGIPAGSFAMLLKVHHAAIDGASGVELISALHDLEPRAVVWRKAPEQSLEPAPNELGLLRHAAGSLVRQPAALFDLVKRSVPALRRVRQGRKENSIRPLGEKERTRFNGRVSAHRVFGGVDLSLAEVASIKRSIEGATVNDVMLAIVGGAMREYLQGEGELPIKSLVAISPVSTRMESEQGEAGNRVASMFVTLRTDVEDPGKRLRLVHEGTLQSKAYLNAIGARLMTDWNSRMPSQVAAMGFRAASATGLMARGRPSANTTVTNVPGPQQPLYLAGAEVVRSYGLGPCMDGLGLFQTVTSYNGQIALTFQACREMLPNPAHYEECIRDSYEALRRATLGGKQSAPAKSRRNAALTPTRNTRRATK